MQLRHSEGFTLDELQETMYVSDGSIVYQIKTRFGFRLEGLASFVFRVAHNPRKH